MNPNCTAGPAGDKYCFKWLKNEMIRNETFRLTIPYCCGYHKVTIKDRDPIEYHMCVIPTWIYTIENKELMESGELTFYCA